MIKIIIFLLCIIFALIAGFILHVINKAKKEEKALKKTAEKIIEYEKEIKENEEKTAALNNCSNTADFNNSVSLLRDLHKRGAERLNK